MPVPSAITDLSTSAAGNSPAGSDTVFPSLDDYIRALSAFIAQNYASLATKQASLGYTPVNRAGDTMTGAQAFTKGTAALPGIAFSGDTNTGIHSSGADILDLVTAGVAQWRVDASGRLRNPSQSQASFRAKTSANRTSAGTFTTYSSETDNGANFDTSTGVFVVPVDGWYEFTAWGHVSAVTTSGAVAEIGIYSSYPGVGAIGQQSCFITNPTGSAELSIASGPVYQTAGATVYVAAASLGGHSSATLACRVFSGRLLG